MQKRDRQLTKGSTLFRCVVGVFAAISVCDTNIDLAFATSSELRIVDSAGLIRAVKAIGDHALLRVILQEGTAAGTPCRAKNVDGISVERRALSDGALTCSFPSVSPGTWEISVGAGVRWKVVIVAEPDVASVSR